MIGAVYRAVKALADAAIKQQRDIEALEARVAKLEAELAATKTPSYWVMPKITCTTGGTATYWFER